MGFTVNDLQDLIRVLEENPQWRAQLRPVILGEEFERMPAIMQELAEAQRRTEENLAQLGIRVDQLAEKIDKLADKVDSIATSVHLLTNQLAEDTGALYEVRFERKSVSLFGEWLRKPRVLTLNDLDAFDEAEMAETITPFESRQLRALDIIIQGFDKREAGHPETLLALEVSRTLVDSDIERAEVRAGLLTKLGYRALPAVGGKYASSQLIETAKKRGVLLRLIDQV